MRISENSNVVGRTRATVVKNHTFTMDRRYSFPKKKLLGLGSYGVVAAGHDSIQNIDVAIKRVRPFSDSNSSIYFLRELRCLKLLGNHPNVDI